MFVGRPVVQQVCTFLEYINYFFLWGCDFCVSCVFFVVVNVLNNMIYMHVVMSNVYGNNNSNVHSNNNF